jgi:hypothetical protein
LCAFAILLSRGGISQETEDFQRDHPALRIWKSVHALTETIADIEQHGEVELLSHVQSVVDGYTSFDPSLNYQQASQTLELDVDEVCLIHCLSLR